MRRLRLLGVAAQAESLRLRREAGGLARRAAWLAAAAAFAGAALILLHVAALAELSDRYGLALAALFVALADLVLAGLLALLGRRRRDPIAEEALAVRRTMLAAAAAGNPLVDILRMAAGGTAVPVLGAFLAERLKSLFRRR